MKPLNILAISGSLRKISYNTAAIEALSRLAPEDVTVKVYKGLGDLPLFNPDLESELPVAVRELKSALAQSQGLIIASPEYAHGVSGVMKNALDWLVSGEEFVYLPVMLINTSPRASHAQAALREVVTTMSGRIIENACVSVPLLSSNLDVEGVMQSPDIAGLLQLRLQQFVAGIEALGGADD
ncbi:predicted flavoprotein [Hahella chejuensis KCTC 2396]|uniref:Predicted flavoprotein n=1 Tax=Hahella chejuensis (strain KCTC 2396) TaxID=349521 RepID=Q2SM56_HAHCH|nr:NADPH-dependent FMN reductase [Hahella chejuensis]ABC28268.1 predicted flavoprotein [Hahella chejuensis KCTC 2396]